MDGTGRGELGWGWIGGAVAVAAVLGLLLEPIGRDASHLGRGLLAALGIALVAVRLWIGRRSAAGDPSAARARTRLRAVLAAAVTLGAFNYFQFDPKVVGGINDHTDTAYYYTNSKYLAELGYDGLYAAALVCDQERGSPRTGRIRQIRDLRNDELVPRAVGLAHGREVKAAFTPERWSAFCHDITYFLDRLSRRSLETNFFVDHGYNPPPTWTIVGGNLALAVDVEQLKWICHVDTVLVIAMFVVLGAVFGLETTLWVGLFYVTTFSGRWPILGMAIMRFDWVAALGIGMAMLRAGRYGLAGASLAYAAMNRVFPAIFFWGWLIEAILDTRREGRVPRRHLLFAAAAGGVAVFMVGAAAVQYGTDTLATSAHHLRMHNESFSSHRVGLGTVAVYRGELTRDEIREFRYAGIHGMGAKELRVRSLKWVLRGLGGVALGLIALYAWRARRAGRPVAAWELLPMAVLPFWCATTPQVNYYNLRVVSFAWHGAGLQREGVTGPPQLHATGMALLFATEVAAQLAHYNDVDRHAVNAFSSLGLLVYFAVVGPWLALRLARNADPPPAAEGSPGDLSPGDPSPSVPPAGDPSPGEPPAGDPSPGEAAR